ncbi:MAG: type II toxin-antitoxin system RelE/ParE family toxin [Deltaproteobacteria bacterium]|nr:type II toxin-antitoxin system RelE/ParE family toxin [Deltaproteobacteria bacterium]
MTSRGRGGRRRGARPVVRWTDRARRDLLQIGDHIAADNPAAAESWVAKLLELAARAGALPRAGRRVPEIGRDDVREVFLRTYRLVYRVTDDGIHVLTVSEGHRLLPREVLADDALKGGNE